MMLERNNKVINVRRFKFTKLVLNVLQLHIFKKLHSLVENGHFTTGPCD
jgi:hypothetical protein